MTPPEILKYATVISQPVFAIIALILIKKTPGFSFAKHTISKSILLMEKSSFKYIFSANFLLKSILDLGFLWYILFKFNLVLNSSVGRLLLTSILMFASLAYFVEGKHKVIHRIIIYTLGILWMAVQELLAHMTGSFAFGLFTDFVTFTVAVIAYWGIFTKKENVIIQIICMSLLYSWLLVFVLMFL